MIEVSNVIVRFGGVTPIDDMSLSFGVGTNGFGTYVKVPVERPYGALAFGPRFQL